MKAKLLSLMILIHSVTVVFLKGTDVYVTTHDAAVGNVLLDTKDEKKQWWKRIEFIAPPAAIAMIIIGCIVLKRTPPKHKNPFVEEPGTPAPLEPLKKVPEVDKENDTTSRPSNPLPGLKKQETDNTLQKEGKKAQATPQGALIESEKTLENKRLSQVNKIQVVPAENGHDEPKPDVEGSTSVQQGNTDNEGSVEGAQNSEKLEEVDTESPKQSVSRSEKEDAVNPDRVENGVVQEPQVSQEERPQALTRWRVAYENAQNNAPLLGIKLAAIPSEGATKEMYAAAVDEAIGTFKIAILTPLCSGKETSEKISPRFKDALILDEQNSLSSLLHDLVEKVINGLSGYILSEETTKEVEILKDTKKSNYDRLNAAVIIFKHPQTQKKDQNEAQKPEKTVEKKKTMPQHGTVPKDVENFLQATTEKQIELLQSSTFRIRVKNKNIMHTDALKELTKYMLEHQNDKRVEKLAPTVVQAIVDNFAALGLGIDKKPFKEAFKSKLSQKDEHK